MVQRHEDDDLIRRFSRVEQVKLERRRREKIEPTLVHQELDGTDRCRRVLFEPDTNLQGWIDGELGRIAENKKVQWNFDFQRGTPAGIPNHNWNWKKFVPTRPPTTGPGRTHKTTAPRSSANGSSSSSPGKIAKRSPNERLQKKITDYMHFRKRSNFAKTFKAETTKKNDDENTPNPVGSQ